MSIQAPGGSVPTAKLIITEKFVNGGKILIVDDDKFNCDIIDGFLMILGFQGSKVFAYNGEQALKEV